MRISDWSSDVCSSDLKRFGNAILSRHPILEHDWKALEPLDDFRSIVHVRLAIDGRGINVYDTHLHWTEGGGAIRAEQVADRSEEHTSELQSPMRNTYAVFCVQKTI